MRAPSGPCTSRIGFPHHRFRRSCSRSGQSLPDCRSRSETQKAIPGAKLIELPGIGHFPQIEALPQWNKALLEFVK